MAKVVYCIYNGDKLKGGHAFQRCSVEIKDKFYRESTFVVLNGTFLKQH